MDVISVIVPTHNNAAVIGRTLRSVETSISYLREHSPPDQPVDVEVVVVNDSSTDGTDAAVNDFIAGKKAWRQIMVNGRSAGSSRNSGVHAATGNILCFLDGDDTYLPLHLHECYRALLHHECGYIRTLIRVTETIHPDWIAPIANSSMICLCVRRECHEFIGGVPDFHVFQREGETFEPLFALCRRNEDIYYNLLLTTFFHGYRLNLETVEYFRYPGNSLDQQLDKFRQPWGTVLDKLSPEEELRTGIVDRLLRWHILRLMQKKRDLGLTANSMPFKI